MSIILDGTSGVTTPGITDSGNLSVAGTAAITGATTLSTVLGVAQGGTGATSLTANNVLLGNGTSAVATVAPGTSGNVLTSDGTTWSSSAGGGIIQLGSPITLSGTGNQFSLTGLTLTSYKQVYITLSNVTIAASSGFSIANTTGNQITNNGFTAPVTANFYSGSLNIDLNTGLISVIFGDKTNPNSLIRNATALTLPIPLGTSLSYTNYNGGPTAIGTASTAVYFWINDAATKSGTITVYGVR